MLSSFYIFSAFQGTELGDGGQGRGAAVLLSKRKEHNMEQRFCWNLSIKIPYMGTVRLVSERLTQRIRFTTVPNGFHGPPLNNGPSEISEIQNGKSQWS